MFKGANRSKVGGFAAELQCGLNNLQQGPLGMAAPCGSSEQCTHCREKTGMVGHGVKELKPLYN